LGAFALGFLLEASAFGFWAFGFGFLMWEALEGKRIVEGKRIAEGGK
jgi:cation transport regulator ChaC